ncbi:MAG: YcxB family protein [Clostridiales bacterium]|nr:YcxB family protein [Clostridiales bacterium]
MESIKAELRLNPSDVFRVFLYSYYCHPRILPMLVVTLYGIWLLILAVRRQNTTVAVIALFIILFFTVFQVCLIRIRANRAVKGNPLYASPFSFVCDETGFTIQQGTHKVSCPWENIHHVMITKNYLVFYPEKVYSYPIPLAQLSSGQVRILALTERYMNASKIKYIKWQRRS